MSKNFLSIYAKSFNWAGFFLSQNTYKNCSDLYDFCRTLDDIADEDLDLEKKKINFKNFKNDFQNKNFDNQVIRKIYVLVDKFKISSKIILDLFDGVESDLNHKICLKTKKDLIVYSYRVAGTVGLMMAKILKVETKNSLKSAIDLGIAMQLTNIARDVVEDNNRNRNYINPDYESIKQTIKLADIFYNSSFKSINEISLRNRFAIIVARRVYRQIGRKILTKKDMENYKNSGKIYVSKIEKLNQTCLSIIDYIILIFLKSNDHMMKKEHDMINEEINLNERI